MTTLRLDKLNRVWDGIKSGELKHDQDFYFCGSSACVVGWLVAFEAVDRGLKLEDYSSVQALGYSDEVESFIDGEEYWYYARNLVGLSELEATLLFCSQATTDIQQAVIDALNAGSRFEMEKVDGSYSGCVRVAGLSKGT